MRIVGRCQADGCAGRVEYDVTDDEGTGLLGACAICGGRHRLEAGVDHLLDVPSPIDLRDRANEPR